MDLDELMGRLDLPIIKTVWKCNKNKYRIVLLGKSETWTVSLLFDSEFPKSLPNLLLEDRGKIGKLAHVDQSGSICIDGRESIIVDYTQPLEVLKKLLSDCVENLDYFAKSYYRDDLLNELEGYYRKAELVNSFYKPSSAPERIYLRKTKADQSNSIKLKPKDVTPLLLSDRSGSLPDEFSNIRSSGQFQQINVIHVPLNEAYLPPAGGQSIDSSYVFSLCKQLSAQHRKTLAKMLKKFNAGRVFLFC